MKHLKKLIKQRIEDLNLHANISKTHIDRLLESAEEYNKLVKGYLEEIRELTQLLKKLEE